MSVTTKEIDDEIGDFMIIPGIEKYSNFNFNIDYFTIFLILYYACSYSPLLYFVYKFKVFKLFKVVLPLLRGYFRI